MAGAIAQDRESCQFPFLVDETLTGELGGKRLELFKEAAPEISRVGVLWDADDQTGAAVGFKEYEAAAHALNIPLQSLVVRHPTLDLEGAFQAVVKGARERAHNG